MESSSQEYQNSTTPAPDSLGDIFHTMYIALTGIMSCLSILGAGATIATFLIISELRKKRHLLIVFLCISDGLTAFGNLLGVIWVARNASLGQGYCVFHSALTNYSSAASYLWNMCIAVHLYIALVHNHAQLADKLRPAFHFTSWTAPAIIVGSALGCGVLGEDPLTRHPSWCWITPGAEQLMWQLICVKGWELLAYVWILTFYALIIVYLTKQKREISMSMELTGSIRAPQRSALEMISGANRKLLLVPVAFFLLRIWGTVRFLVNAFDVNRTLWASTVWLAPIQGLGDSGQGFANFVLYCLLPGSVRRHLCRTGCHRTDTAVSPLQESST